MITKKAPKDMKVDLRRVPWRKRADLKKSLFLQVRITSKMAKELEGLAEKFNCESKSYFVRKFLDAILSNDAKEVSRYLADIEARVTGQSKMIL